MNVRNLTLNIGDLTGNSSGLVLKCLRINSSTGEDLGHVRNSIETFISGHEVNHIGSEVISHKSPISRHEAGEFIDLRVDVAHFISDGDVVKDRDGVVEDHVEPFDLTSGVDDVVEIEHKLVDGLHEAVHSVETVRLYEVALRSGGGTADLKSVVLETLGKSVKS